MPDVPDHPDAPLRRLAADHSGASDWFEPLYVAAAAGRAEVPWDRDAPSAALAAWARGRDLAGRRTLVVGCGYGRDAEFLAERGADVVAFDIAATAIATARDRHPTSTVEYVVADLLAAPPAWHHAFDLVVECTNVQALPEPARAAAVRAAGEFVAPGGRLVVVEFGREDDAAVEPGPPWPFTGGEVASFAQRGLVAEVVEQVRDPGPPPGFRWRAEFVRPAIEPVLYHLVEQEVWEQAQLAGEYSWSTRGVTYADEGFVHMSRAEQVAGTLRLFYADVRGPLVLLVVDPDLVGAEIRVEDGFPHVYGPLPVAAVVDVVPVDRGADGAWRAPV